MIKQSVLFGTKKIEYGVKFANRKTLGITVTPELEVLVKAPPDAKLDKVKEKVHKKAAWIMKQQNFFLTFHPKTPPRKFIGGETHLYLGRQYRLKLFKSRKNFVKLKGRYIEVHCSDSTKIKPLVKEWYLEHARIKFESYAQSWVEKFNGYGVSPSGLVMREMPKRWGSCTPRGKIILNPELIKAPKGCIEYVIVHELCHLIHHDHTKQFVDLQTKVMPKWEKWKERLEKVMA